MSPKRKCSVLSGWSEDTALPDWEVAAALLNFSGCSSKTAVSVILKEGKESSIEQYCDTWEKKRHFYMIFSLVCHVHSALEQRLYTCFFPPILQFCSGSVCRRLIEKKKNKTNNNNKPETEKIAITQTINPSVRILSLCCCEKTRFTELFHRQWR